MDSGGTYIHARRGITNIDVADGFHPVNGLTVNYNIIQNVAQRCVSLNNNGTVSTGGSIDQNLFRTFGTDPNIGGIAVLLLQNAYAAVTNNTVYVTPANVGLQMENFTAAGSATLERQQRDRGAGCAGD